MSNFQIYASLNKIRIRLIKSKGFFKTGNNHHSEGYNTGVTSVIPLVG